MTKQECIDYVKSHMEIRYATKNGAYQAQRYICTIGSINHSVGCAQPNTEVFYKFMNDSNAGWGVTAIIGDFHKGEGKIILSLPPNARNWGCGKGPKGSWNNSHVQWEICEPAGHSYAGGTMINYDVKKNKAYFDRMWKMVVAWNVYICDLMGIDPEDIHDHAESHAYGYGSNHSDVGQWWPKHGKSMVHLRNEVAAILNEKDDEEVIDMTRDELVELIDERINAKVTTFETIDQVPDYWKAAIQELIDKNVINGGTDNSINNKDVNLSLDTTKAIVILKGYIDALFKK